MANSFQFKDHRIRVGDTITVDYKIKEGEKTRVQPFKGIVIKIRGASLNSRMITVRKISHTGIGIERIFPLSSPNLASIKVNKKTLYHRKAKLYFIRDLSEAELRHKLYFKK